jgi:hypothetical protein
VRGRDLLDLLAPPRCLACGRRDPGALCPACHGGAPWRDTGDDSSPPGTCGLDGCTTLLWLEGPVVGWLHRFKYPAAGFAGLDGAASGLIGWLAERLGDRLAPGPCDLVVPIPLHPRRLRGRGFNPALCVARAAFARWRTPVEPSVLVRVRDTPSQTGLDRPQRRSNVANAFACRPGRAWPPRCVWLVDDVVTTGATLDSAATTLRGHGVSHVVGVGLARTRAESESSRDIVAR